MIEVKNLNLKYKIKDNKFKTILDNISIKFPSSGLVFIVGKSGSGKSSLLSIMEGFLKPTSGLVKFKDKNINESKFDLENYYSSIGVLFQDFNLFKDYTLKENLELVSNDKSKIDELIDKYNLNTVKNNKIYNLSGGEKQRCALIRALIKDPEIIFADEPTGALDNKNSDLLMDDLYEISKEKLVIVVTHNEEFLSKYNSYFIRLEDGKIIESNLSDNENQIIEFCDKKIKIKENIKLLAKKIIYSNLKMSFFSLISLVFSYTFLIFSVCFKTSFNTYSSSVINKYYSNDVFIASKIIESNNNSYLKVVKKEKPKNEEIFELLNEENIEYSLNPNLSYFLNQNTLYINEDNYKNVTFYPSINDDLIENEVVINNEFKNKYNLNINDEIEVLIKKTYSFYLNDEKDIFKEEIDLRLNFIVKEIYNEFPFLNTPKIYYNYEYLFNLLQKTPAFNLSKLLDNQLNLINLYDYSSNNEELDSYSYYLFSDDVNKITSKDFQKKLKENNFEIQNEAYVMSQSFLSIMESLDLALLMFNAIIFLTSIILLIFINISIISSSKRDLAILFSLGFNKKRMIFPYFIKDLITFLISFLISFLLNNIFIKKINALIESKYLLDFNITLNFSYISIIFLISILIILIISIFISKHFRNISIYKELKEE